jgi:hypothetical protein
MAAWRGFIDDLKSSVESEILCKEREFSSVGIIESLETEAGVSRMELRGGK